MMCSIKRCPSWTGLSRAMARRVAETRSGISNPPEYTEFDAISIGWGTQRLSVRVVPRKCRQPRSRRGRRSPRSHWGRSGCPWAGGHAENGVEVPQRDLRCFGREALLNGWMRRHMLRTEQAVQAGSGYPDSPAALRAPSRSVNAARLRIFRPSNQYTENTCISTSTPLPRPRPRRSSSTTRISSPSWRTSLRDTSNRSHSEPIHSHLLLHRLRPSVDAPDAGKRARGSPFHIGSRKILGNLQHHRWIATVVRVVAAPGNPPASSPTSPTQYLAMMTYVLSMQST